MSALDFYIKVAQTLDEIEAPYMIVGADQNFKEITNDRVVSGVK